MGMAFPSNPLRISRFSRTIRQHPTWFGIPFILLIVGASFGLQIFTQTRYDLRDQHITAVSKREQLGLNKNKKKFDIREEYYRLSALEGQDWEQKRISRPEGTPEWGVPPETTLNEENLPER